MRRRIAVLAAIVIALVAVTSQSASAASTTVSFVAPETTAVFGESWVMEITVGSPRGTGAVVTAASGSVDVVVSGIAGTYATLPVQDGGAAFFTQPADQPLLAAGTYSVTAIFNPSAGSDLTGSASAAATLTITPLEVTTAVSATSDPAVSAEPVITAELGGAYVEATGTVPAGIWSFEVTAAGDDRVVFETRRLQDPADLEAINVIVDARLATSTDYTLAWTFEPVEEIAGGLAITTEGTTTFRTADGTIFTALANPVELPLWSWITIAGVLLGLLATAIVLLVLARRRASTPADAAGESPADDDDTVDPVGVDGEAADDDPAPTLEDLGLDRP